MQAQVTAATALNPSFRVAGLEMTRIWHCFGNYARRVDLWTIQRMLRASGTNVLPINTHRLSRASLRDGLEIGFGGVTVDELRERRSFDGMVLMLNINHQTTAAEAVAKTALAHELTGEPVVKLEVLNEDLRTSNDDQLIEAVRELRRLLPQLILMPLVSNDWVSAQRLVQLGCPLLRVMGSDIGSGRGIIDRETFGRVCTLPVPVVLDGGVATAADFAMAHAAGAQGCLINSALFAGSAPPDVVLRAFVRACAPVLASSTRADGRQVSVNGRESQTDR
jgi:thiazole synthase